MEILGHISFKEILYCNVRINPHWFDQLPNGNWIAFTIANKEDNELVSEVSAKCLDSKVSCICSAGQIASKTEDSFVDEIVLRKLQSEIGTVNPDKNENAPMMTFHTNFSEGFWFATSIANPSIAGEYLDIDKVICIDMTKNGVKKYLRELIGKYNSGELPSDNEFEEPEYDYEIE